MDNFLSKVTKGTKQAAAQVGIATKIAKLNVEIATQKSEKDRHIKIIGTKVYAIYAKKQVLDGKLVQDEISSELSLIDRIESHIEDLQHQIAQLQADFRNTEGKDIVDADDVKETYDDSSNK